MVSGDDVKYVVEDLIKYFGIPLAVFYIMVKIYYTWFNNQIFSPSYWIIFVILYAFIISIYMAIVSD